MEPQMVQSDNFSTFKGFIDFDDLRRGLLVSKPIKFIVL